MNQEIGSSCPLQTSCPDNYGTLPSCAGLAVPYVPFQQDRPNKYSQSEALSNGTLFPGLNLPFHLKVEGSTLPTNPLVELQALEFVVLELGIYLDTHPRYGGIHPFQAVCRHGKVGQSRLRKQIRTPDQSRGGDWRAIQLAPGALALEFPAE